MRSGFDISTLKALVITHVHIDHVGRLPYLLAAGFKGPILCSEPSALLLPLVIEDALKIGFTRNARLIEQFQAQLKRQLVAVPYGQWHSVVEDDALTVRVKLKRAGHILGSSYVEVALNDTALGNAQRVVFSGDLGAPHTPLLPPYQADVLVLESTYGDRNHEGRQARGQALKTAIEQALTNRGTVIIPAFSIGRTQELLYELETIVHGAAPTSDWHSLEVIVDSPPGGALYAGVSLVKAFLGCRGPAPLALGAAPVEFRDGVHGG